MGVTKTLTFSTTVCTIKESRSLAENEKTQEPSSRGGLVLSSIVVTWGLFALFPRLLFTKATHLSGVSLTSTVCPYVPHLYLPGKNTQLVQWSLCEARRGALLLKSGRGGSHSGRTVWGCFSKPVSTEGPVISQDIRCFLLQVDSDQEHEAWGMCSGYLLSQYSPNMRTGKGPQGVCETVFFESNLPLQHYWRVIQSVFDNDSSKSIHSDGVFRAWQVLGQR